VKPWMWWLGGILVPFGLIAVYRHVHAGSTDVVTDVLLLPGGPTGGVSPVALRVVYDTGPADDIAVVVPPQLAVLAPAWRNSGVILLAKQVLMGATRDRIASMVQAAAQAGGMPGYAIRLV
jgi:hypothetical protein